MANEEFVSLESVKSKLKSPKTNDAHSFFLKAESVIENFTKQNSIATVKKYKTIVKILREYRKNKNLHFEDITVSFLQNYEMHLQSKGHKINTIHNHLKSIKAIYNSAIKEGVFSPKVNPFFTFKLKIDHNVRKEKLTVEEIIRIEKLDLTSNTLLSHAKNVFLFSFYCAGMRISDVLQIKWRNALQTED